MKKIESIVSGIVVKIMVQEGSILSAGDEALIVESMKMEIPLEVEVSGEVAEVLVQEGDMVEEGQELIRLK